MFNTINLGANWDYKFFHVYSKNSNEVEKGYGANMTLSIMVNQ